MKTSKNFTWTRLMRSTIALMLVFAMLLCGCASVPDDEGGKKENNKENGITLGDGDGKLEAQDAVDGVSAVYGLLLKILGGEIEMDTAKDMAMRSELVVTLGDEIKTQLGQTVAQMGLSEDLSWFKSIGLAMTTTMNNDLMQMDVNAKVNGESIIAASVIMDMLNSMVYASLPEINDQTIGMSLNNGPQPAPDTDMGGTLVGPSQGTTAIGGASSVLGLLMGGDFTEIFAEHTELIQALPTEEQMNKLITSYLDVVLEYLDDGTTTQETLTQGDVSMNVDATTYVITQYDVLDAAVAVLTKAKTDAELEKALDAFGALVNALVTDRDENAEQIDLHAELMAEIDDMLEELQDTKTNTEDDELLRFCAYTADDKTVGFQLYLTAMGVVAKPGVPEYDVEMPKPLTAMADTSAEPSKATSITVYSLEDGDKTALYLNVADSFEFSGTGTVKSKKASGNYSLKLGGVEFLLVELENFTADALTSETLEGTVRLRLGQGMKDKIETPNMFYNENTMVELQVQIDGEDMVLNAKLYSGETFLLGIASSMETFNGDDIQVPENYVDVSGQEQLAQWLGNMKFDAVLENLEDADVPAELIEMLTSMIMGGVPGGGEDVEYPEEMYPEYGY